MFRPSTRQDPAAMSNAEPFPSHQTGRDRKGRHGAALGDLDHLATSSGFMSEHVDKEDQAGSQLSPRVQQSPYRH